MQFFIFINKCIEMKGFNLILRTSENLNQFQFILIYWVMFLILTIIIFNFICIDKSYEEYT